VGILLLRSFVLHFLPRYLVHLVAFHSLHVHTFDSLTLFLPVTLINHLLLIHLIIHCSFIRYIVTLSLLFVFWYIHSFLHDVAFYSITSRCPMITITFHSTICPDSIHHVPTLDVIVTIRSKFIVTLIFIWYSFIWYGNFIHSTIHSILIRYDICCCLITFYILFICWYL